MARRKKLSVREYLEKHNASFMKFGDLFVKQLTDSNMIIALAQKDLEKLAKVWKLVFEMIAENSGDNSQEKLLELIGAYNDLNKEAEE
ncbi:MAG: hypothetical protein J1F09_03860 [Oscillospiraceae bacterium]|nr:hypothetical protein [Oscillospiraceae bacterium]